MDDPAYQRLRWHCRRGLLELDLVLRGFLDRHYTTLTASELDTFGALLEYPDQTLLGWLNGLETAPDNGLKQIVRKIRQPTDYKYK